MTASTSSCSGSGRRREPPSSSSRTRSPRPSSFPRGSSSCRRAPGVCSGSSRSTCPTRVRRTRGRTRGSSSSRPRYGSCCASRTVPARPRPSARAVTRLKHGLAEWAPALAILVLGLVGWELAVKAFGIQKFLLPKPSEILSTFWDERHILWPAGWYTFTEAFWGFVVGCWFGGRRGARARPLPRRRLGVDAVLHRRERDPDHRLRPDRKRVVRDREGLEDLHRGAALLLPGARQHAARADVGAAAAGRADAFLRGRQPRRLPSRPDPDVAAVRLRGPEDRKRARDDRRHRRASTSAARRSSSGSRSRTRPRCSSSRRPGQRSSWLVSSASVSTWPCRWRRC